MHDLFSLWGMERNIGNKIPVSLLLCSEAEVASAWTSWAEAQEVHLEKLSHFPHDKSTFILIWCSYRKLSINNAEVCSLLFPSQVMGNDSRHFCTPLGIRTLAGKIFQVLHHLIAFITENLLFCLLDLLLYSCSLDQWNAFFILL